MCRHLVGWWAGVCRRVVCRTPAASLPLKPQHHSGGGGGGLDHPPLKAPWPRAKPPLKSPPPPPPTAPRQKTGISRIKSLHQHSSSSRKRPPIGPGGGLSQRRCEWQSTRMRPVSPRGALLRDAGAMSRLQLRRRRPEVEQGVPHRTRAHRLSVGPGSVLSAVENMRNCCFLEGVLARLARAGHLLLTIPHPCLFLPSLTKQSGVPFRCV